MSNILQIYFLQFVRNLTNHEDGRKFPFFLLIALLFFITFQIQFLGEATQQTVTFLGWGIAGTFVFYTAVGMISNRLPSKMEDVIWLYSVPLSLAQIAYATVIWQVMLRGALWMVSGVAGDLARFLLDKPFANLTGRSLLLLLLLAALENWLVAMSCARTRFWTRIILSGCAVGVTASFGFLIYSSVAGGRPSGGWAFIAGMLDDWGQVFVGSYSLSLLLFVLLLFLVSAWVIVFAASSVESKEKLVKEADFWSEFKDHHAFISSIQNKEEKSWFGFPGLSGLFAFLWMELLIAKKSIVPHALQFAGLVTLIYWVMTTHTDWVDLVLIMTMAGFVMNAYFSGLIRHMISGDLFLFPGKLWKKVLLLETAHMAWILVPFAFAVWLGIREGLIGKGQLLLTISYGAALIFLLYGIRWTAAIQTYHHRGHLPIPVYYKNLFFCTVGSAFLIAFLTLIFSKWQISPYIAPVAMAALGVTLWVISFIYRGKPYSLTVYAVVPTLFFLLYRLVEAQ